MSLINCPECNKEVSEKAKTCPNCGHPIKENIFFIKLNKLKNELDPPESFSDLPSVKRKKGGTNLILFGKGGFSNATSFSKEIHGSVGIRIYEDRIEYKPWNNVLKWEKIGYDRIVNLEINKDSKLNYLGIYFWEDSELKVLIFGGSAGPLNDVKEKIEKLKKENKNNSEDNNKNKSTNQEASLFLLLVIIIILLILFRIIMQSSEVDKPTTRSKSTTNQTVETKNLSTTKSFKVGDTSWKVRGLLVNGNLIMFDSEEVASVRNDNSLNDTSILVLEFENFGNLPITDLPSNVNKTSLVLNNEKIKPLSSNEARRFIGSDFEMSLANRFPTTFPGELFVLAYPTPEEEITSAEIILNDETTNSTEKTKVNVDYNLTDY